MEVKGHKHYITSGRWAAFRTVISHYHKARPLEPCVRMWMCRNSGVCFISCAFTYLLQMYIHTHSDIKVQEISVWYTVACIFNICYFFITDILQRLVNCSSKKCTLDYTLLLLLSEYTIILNTYSHNARFKSYHTFELHQHVDLTRPSTYEHPFKYYVQAIPTFHLSSLLNSFSIILSSLFYPSLFQFVVPGWTAKVLT